MLRLAVLTTFLFFGTSIAGAQEAPSDSDFPEEPKLAPALPDVDQLLEEGAKIAPEPDETPSDTPPITVKEIDEPDVIEPERPDYKRTKRLLRTVDRFLETAREETQGLARLITRQVKPTARLDLKPVMDDETWTDATVLLRANKCRDAKKKLYEAVGGENAIPNARPEVQYLAARIWRCAGESSRGQKMFQTLANGDDGVAQLAKLALGTSRHKLQPGESLSAHLKAIEKLHNYSEARKKLDVLRKGAKTSGERNRIDLARATVLEKSGKIDEARSAYMKLYRKTLSRRFNDTVEHRIRRFEKKHKQSVLSYGENIDLMRKLIMRGKYKDAKKVSIANAKARRVKGREIKGWMYYRLALQAEHKKKRKDAVELFAKAEKLVRDSEVRPRLYFGWARALRRLDQDSKAIELYGRLCEEFKTHHLCDNALYESGRLLQYADKHKRAIDNFSDVLERFPDTEHRADATWRRGFSYYLTKDYENARDDFKTLEQKFGDYRDASELSLGLKAAYWIAASTQKLGEEENAVKAFKHAYSRGPLTWYGRLAAARLDELGISVGDHAVVREVREEELMDFRTLVVPKHKRLEPAAVLTRVGLYEDAMTWLKREAALHPSPQGTERFLSAMYLRQGRPDRAHWVMKRHIEESGPTAESVRDFAVAFPNDYLGQSAKYGNRFNVSPFLVSAIIRQESGFRPTVKSWAGAVGLMQLMPRTAKYTARVFANDKSYSRKQLKNPDTNIKLGTMYIRVHTAHANDSIPLALAGYNAGPAPLEKWIKRYGDRELDAFVESITYREARGYVRKVFTSFVRYSALYGGEVPSVTLKVPALRPWGMIPESNKIPASAPVSVLFLP